MLAEVIAVISRSEAGVAVGRADHPVLIGVHPGALGDQQPPLQRLADIGAGLHIRRGLFREIEIAQFPPGIAIAGEFVVGRHERMAFAVPLDLGDLDQRFARRPAPGIGRAHRPAGWVAEHEHHAVGQVGVVRDGQRLAAGGLLVLVEIVPQPVGLGRVIGGERRELGHPAATIAIDHVAVQVVAAIHQRIFEAEEGSELARFVIAFDRGDMAQPVLLQPLRRAGRIGQLRGQSAAGLRVNQLAHRLDRLLRPGMHHVVPPPHQRLGHQCAGGVVEFLDRGEPVRMIGDHQKIERTGQLGLDPGR